MSSNFSNLSSAMAIQQPGNGDSSQPINISFSRNNSLYQNPRLRRESIAHSQGVGGVSWGSVGISSWLRDEVFIQNHNNMHQNHHQSQNLNHSQNHNAGMQGGGNVQYQQQRNQSINLFNGNFNNNNAMDLRGDSIMMYDSSVPNSSYLADLEANYCKDYSCCGQILPTLHDLLRHYEEMHIQQDPTSIQLNGMNLNTNPNNVNHNNLNSSSGLDRMRMANNSIGAVPTNEVFLNNHLNTKQNLNNNNKKFSMNPKSNNKISSFNLNMTYDQNNNHNLQNNELHKTLSNFNFGDTNQASLNKLNSQEQESMQFDFSTNNGASYFQNDRLTKDLENQTKMFHEQIQHQLNNPQSAYDGNDHTTNNLNNNTSNNFNLNNMNNLNNTHQSNDNNSHADLNNTSNNTNTHNSHDTGIPGNITNNHQKIKNTQLSMHKGGGIRTHNDGEMDMDHDTQFQMDVDDANMDDDDMGQEVCIDDPARRLYVIERKDERPFQCPVLGCSKTYKNQNGLKYHRLHGHQNQTLRENSDGTLSVINPDSDSPYPNGMAFEKDKPYRCEVCGKRYKNLNGLKYHRGHTTH